MTQKNVNDEGEIEKKVYKEWITPASRMGFIKGCLYCPFGIVVSILIGSLFILYIIGKLCIRFLFDIDKVRKE